MSESLRPHGPQHAMLPCPSLTPGACWKSHLSGWWCHPTIASSVIPFSSCLQSFPASGSFLMSQLFTSGDQSIGASASASVFPVNIQDWFPLGLIWPPCSPRDSRESSPALQFKSINFSVLSLLHRPTLTSIHDYLENHSFDYMDFVSKLMSLLFNTLSRFVIGFLPRSKHLLISWLQSPSTVILEPKKVCHCFHFFPICHEVMVPVAMIFVFWMLSFKPSFSLFSSAFIKRLFIPLHFLPPG